MGSGLRRCPEGTQGASRGSTTIRPWPFPRSHRSPLRSKWTAWSICRSSTIAAHTRHQHRPALYVHIPKTQVIFVLAALVVGEGDTDARWSDGSLSVEQLDLSGHGGSFPDIPEGYAQPLHESRAVASDASP